MAGQYSDDESYDDYSNTYSESTREYSDDESYGDRGISYSKSYTPEYSDDESYDNYVESKANSGEYSDDDSYALGDYGTTYSGSKAGSQVSVHQDTYRVRNEHKQSGSYERFTAKDKTVRGEPFVDRYGNRGYKNEHTTTSNYKVGDKRGYTEYQREDKVKHVDFNKSSYSNNNKAVRSYSKYRKY
ncbi:hypothetical protein DCAR_0520573 [Daucus carota subsp. sativus]|uniref:Uncharacterized protein n=1 Tax=Daucus carota subsp. sativus TaxID=79200 RepID=A0A161YM51_DAUCS|nr:PREDICTED: uncharacterized protein LOC108221557 [Daucus carota subsp. sativus]WOH01192.1 hypothetical protein DCAR_0520573 [Daucus carota subsp. sativus]